MNNSIRPRVGRWRSLAVIGGAVALLAACGGNDTAATPAPTAGNSTASGAAVVTARSGPLGTYLTDASGKTLYLFAADTTGTSTCYDSCARFWPPLTTTGVPRAGDGVTASRLGTTARNDGATQVVYNGHPLYYFSEDAAPGDTAGQGLDEDGGLWWVMSPAGDAIMVPASAPATSGGDAGTGYDLYGSIVHHISS